MSEELRPSASLSDEPLVLGPEVLRKSSPPSPGRDPHVAAPRPRSQPRPSVRELVPARITDNECILFDETHSASWIVYPPRSAYSFVHRTDPTATIVEHRVWSPMTEAEFHQLSAAAGCSEHGVECAATVAITAAVNRGYDPFR